MNFEPPFEWEDYLKRIQILKKNREQVPLEELRTKYKRPYTALLQDIKKKTEVMLFHSLIDGLPFNNNEKEEWRAFSLRVKKAFQEEKRCGTFRRITQAVFHEYDPDKALEISALTLWPRIWYQAYGPYWLKHCIKQDNGEIWNDLIQMKWNSGTQTWRSKDGSSCSLMLPPTEELLREDEQVFCKAS